MALLRRLARRARLRDRAAVRLRRGVGGLQYVTDDAWIADLGIRYSLGVDGLNLWLVALTTLMFAAVGAVGRDPAAGAPAAVRLPHRRWPRPPCSARSSRRTSLLFVLFFDLMLVPFYFLVGQWGGPDRVAATFKLVIYTLVGSLLMLAAAVATGVLTARRAERSRDVRDRALANATLGERAQRWIFVAFALAFLIKMPAFPFHGWMPDGYREHAAAGARGVLRRAVEGRRLRLPADRPAALPGRRARTSRR